MSSNSQIKRIRVQMNFYVQSNMNTTLLKSKRKRWIDNLVVANGIGKAPISVKHRRSKWLQKMPQIGISCLLVLKIFFVAPTTLKKLFIKRNTTCTSVKKFFCKTGTTGVPDTSYRCCSQQKNLIISH